MRTFNKDLWEKIKEFQLDDCNASLPFSKRLARDNNWSHEYADKAIAEYKKFIYLVANTRNQLTPSDQVDQVWHLHLLYTDSYWNKLCKSTLGFKLHHIPTKGGVVEQERFKTQYEETLRLYQETFGYEPNPKVWPSVKRRFESVENPDIWEIFKPSIGKIKLFKIVFVPLSVSLIPLSMVACKEGIENTGLWPLIGLAIFICILAFWVFLFYIIPTYGT